MKQIKIAFIHNTRGDFSGAARNIFRLINRIDRVKIEPVMLCQAECELTKKVSKLGIEVLIVPYPPELEIYEKKLVTLHAKRQLLTLKGIARYSKSLIPILSSISPYVIWCDNIRSFLASYYSAKKCGIPTVWNIWLGTTGGLFYFINRLGLLLSDVIIVDYDKQKRKLFGNLCNHSTFKKKIVTLYSGVSDFDMPVYSNIRTELGINHDDIVFLMASSIMPRKGQIDLIEAMKFLTTEFKNIHLIVAGEPLKQHLDSIKYYEKLVESISKYELNNQVHLVGWRTDIVDILQSSDVYVTTSYHEGMPDTIREAMKIGKPVIATNVNGIPEAVEDGKSGFLFKPGDIRSLINYIRQLIFNPQLRVKMGEEGKRIIEERFSTEKYARNFEDMIFNLLKAKRG